MAEKKVVQKKEEEKPPSHWALTGDEVLKRLQGKHFVLHLLDGEVMEGTLVGYDRYNLTLMRDDGLLLIPKHAVKYLRIRKSS